MSEFKCHICKITYGKTRSDEWNEKKAAEEYLEVFKGYENDATYIVCDDCYKVLPKPFI